MEVDFQVGQECSGRLDEAVEVVPPAMAGQRRLEVAPHALDQVELRGIGGQEEGLEPICEALPVRAYGMALVGAGVVEHEHGRFAWRQRGDEVVEDGHERALPFARARLPDDLPAGVVDGANDRELVVVARRGNL